METNTKASELRNKINERKAKWCRDSDLSMLFHLAGSVRQFGQGIRWGSRYPEHVAEKALEIANGICEQFDRLKDLLKDLLKD